MSEGQLAKQRAGMREFQAEETARLEVKNPKVHLRDKKKAGVASSEREAGGDVRCRDWVGRKRRARRSKSQSQGRPRKALSPGCSLSI